MSFNKIFMALITCLIAITASASVVTINNFTGQTAAFTITCYKGYWNTLTSPKISANGVYTPPTSFGCSSSSQPIEITWTAYPGNVQYECANANQVLTLFRQNSIVTVYTPINQPNVYLCSTQ